MYRLMIALNLSVSNVWDSGRIVASSVVSQHAVAKLGMSWHTLVARPPLNMAFNACLLIIAVSFFCLIVADGDSLY